MPQLPASRHIKYYERCLVMFPREAQVYDSSHSSLVYFCLLGLDLLGRSADAAAVGEYTAHLRLPGGFRGSATHTLAEPSIYDPPNLSSTFFCICMLGLAKDSAALGALDRDEIHAYVRQCQLPSGNFACASSPQKPIGEASVRHLFTGVAILSLLGVVDRPVFDAAASYILQCQTYDGGFGETPNAGESHAGLTYCCVAALALMQIPLPDSQHKKLLAWLAHRQQPSGGFNGRTNKPEDTCYAFWVSASLHILDPDLIERDLGEKFLLEHCQDELLGGFAKTEGGRADPLHACLGLCALSLMRNEQRLNPALCLPYEAAEFIRRRGP